MFQVICYIIDIDFCMRYQIVSFKENLTSVFKMQIFDVVPCYFLYECYF